MEPTLEAIKGFGGYTTTVSLWVLAILTWWKGLPTLIEAGSKFLEAWSNRAASIEDRLNASVAAQFARYDATIANLEKHIKDCDDERVTLRERVRVLEDAKVIQDREMTGLRRQLASYETASDRLPPNNSGAVKLPPRGEKG